MAKRFFFRVFCGFFLGVSVFAPGFSGSIVAIIMGIYQDIVRIASNPFKDLKKNIEYCFPLAIGVAVSAVLFVVAFRYLFETHEKATYLLFVGLIAGNLPVIWGDTKKCGFKKHYPAGGAVAFIAALALGFYSFGISQPEAAGVVSGLPVLALGGFLGGVTALIPGMSVSMVLIIMTVYYPVIFIADQLLHFDFTYIVHFGVFFVCAVVGLVITSRGIKAIFKKYPGFANSLVFGFMAGSLISLLAGSIRMEDTGFNWLLGGAMLVAGLCISMLFVFFGKAMKKIQ